MFKPWMAALAGALVLCGGALAATDDWRTYSYDALGLSLPFPTPPKVEKQSDPGTDTQRASETTTAVSSPDETRTYRLEVDRVLDGPAPDPDLVLGKLPGALSTRLEMPIISQTRFQYEGYMALDLLLGPNADNIYFRSRYILRDNDMIQLVSVRMGGEPPVDQFFTGFKLKPAAAN